MLVNRGALRLGTLLLSLALASPALGAAGRAARPLRLASAPRPGSALSFRNPLSYVARLNSPLPPLGAGAGLLADRRAQRWLQTHRPAAYPGLLQRALQLEDLREALASPDILKAPEAPRLVRDVLEARLEDPRAAVPAKLLELVDANPALRPDRAIYEQAVLQWDTLDAELRAELGEVGLDEARWGELVLSERSEAFRMALMAVSQRSVTARPGQPEYAVQLRAAMQRLLPALSREEHVASKERIESAERLAAALERAERLVAAAGPGRWASSLREASRQDDLDAATAALGRVFDSLGASEERAALEGPIRSLRLGEAERARLESRLADELRRQLRGDAYGRRVLAGIARGGVRIRIGHAGLHSVAQYSVQSKEIVLGERFLAIVLRERGVEQRRLLEDDDALRETAAVLASAVVHEGTHHLQAEWWERRRETQNEQAFYSIHAEHEAFLQEANYLVRRGEKDPAFAALIAGLPEAIRENVAVHSFMRERPGEFRAAFRVGYRGTPTLARAASRLIVPGAHAQAGYVAQVRPIEEALAERRRMSRAEREELERDPDAVPTATLRQWVRGADALSASNARLAARLWSRYLSAVDRLSAALGVAAPGA